MKLHIDLFSRTKQRSSEKLMSGFKCRPALEGWARMESYQQFERDVLQ